MTDKDDVRAWLMSRRAKVTPQQAGIPEFGDGERRVPGLRREEVAMLADVSIDYYTKLERGDISGASESVLKAIARALQLDDVERAHLFALAETAPRVASGHRTPTEPLPASVQRVLDSMAMPAFAYNARRTCSVRTCWAARCTRCTSRPINRTSPASSSSTRGHGSSLPTGSSPAA